MKLPLDTTESSRQNLVAENGSLSDGLAKFRFDSAKEKTKSLVCDDCDGPASPMHTPREAPLNTSAGLSPTVTAWGSG